MEIVIATQNAGKMREFKNLFKSLPQFDIVSLRKFPEYSPPPEEGESFEEIAQKKALHASQTLGVWVLADDSGLVVPALKGMPGVRSRRYAGENATDAENRNLLLSNMSGLEEEQRYAYMACGLALASPEKIIKCVVAHCEGYIICEERGGNGFGYDPLFVKHDYDKTFAELGEALKNKISHRYKAFEKLYTCLATLQF